ncbi:MAG: hypothetical protein ABSC14_09405, partial [Desulfomonilia bacterium]
AAQHHRVPAGEHRKRIDVYLTHHIENATRSKVQQAIEAGFAELEKMHAAFEKHQAEFEERLAQVSDQ